MLQLFDKIDVKEINENPVKLIGFDSFLLTAGTINKYNTMTAAWGGIGYLWNKPVVYCFIRPTRFTYSFFEKSSYFSLCFFEEEFQHILDYCGSHTGRKVDKEKNTGLIPLEGENNTIIFQQSRLALECKKIYFDDIKPEHFLDASIDKLYNKDYHRMYIGEILNCVKKIKK